VALLSVVSVLTLGAVAQTVRGHLVNQALRTAGEAGGLPLNQLAVLYFQDRARGEDLTYLADGLTESLIRRLSQAQALTVLSNNASDRYRDSNLPLDAIASAFEVGTIVDGTVEKRGERLRVTVSLADGFSGAEIQRQTVERPADDLFALQDTLAEEWRCCWAVG
jgi:TolB-like protein